MVKQEMEMSLVTIGIGIVNFLHRFSYRTDKPIGLVGFNVKVYTCQGVTLDK